MTKNITDNENIKNNYLDSKKIVIKNNYWNQDHEELLQSLQKSSFRLSKEYKQKYFKLRDKLQWYRRPIIILSSIGGFLSLSNSGYIPPEYNKWVSLFVGFTNLTVTIISLIESFKKIDTRMNGSYTTYVNFQKLHDEISIIKRIPPNERDTNGYATINTLYRKYESYFIDAPILRKFIVDDIGFNEFEEIETPKITKPINEIENQILEIKNSVEKLNLKYNSGIINSISTKFNINNDKNDKNDKKNNKNNDKNNKNNKNQKNDDNKIIFKSKYNNKSFYNSYDNNNENNDNGEDNINKNDSIKLPDYATILKKNNSENIFNSEDIENNQDGKDNN